MKPLVFDCPYQDLCTGQVTREGTDAPSSDLLKNVWCCSVLLGVARCFVSLRCERWPVFRQQKL